MISLNANRSIFQLSRSKLQPHSLISSPNLIRNELSRTYRLLTIPKRLNSTSTPLSSPSSSSSSSSSNSSSEDAAKPKPNVGKDMIKLLKLAKPEYTLMGYALICLFITSATSMLLPLFIGKIIDAGSDELVKIKEEADTENQPDKEKNDSDGLLLGLEPIQFYSVLAVLFTVGAVANFGRTYLLRTVGERLVARLRSRLFSKILEQDSIFFDIGPTGNGMKTGDLISRISNDAQIISKTLSGNINDGIRASISGLVGLSMMCYVSWKLTLCMSLMFPPLILMSLFYGRKIKTLSKLIQENLGAMTKVTEEKLNGIKTIQSFSQQKLMVHQYNEEVKHIFDNGLREGKLSGIYYAINGFLGNTTIIGLLVIGNQLIINGDLSVGDLSSFMMYALYTGGAVFGLGNFYSELMKGLGASERIFELIDYRSNIPVRSGEKVDNLHGNIEFRDIKFKYPSRTTSTIFNGLNLTIEKGSNICIVGPSGSGKSTISQLLLRFYDPIEGQVIVNGYNISDLNLNYYRTKLGYVQQESLLFNGTIRENILFGRNDATEEDIYDALRLSNSFDFVNNLPDGLDTNIGSLNSTQLSGGQKQRLSLARTLIRKPKILLLDEATSALDSISEEIVLTNLKHLNNNENITIISIAHRLSTIKNSDRIIVLDHHGNIVEDGQFNELYENPDSALNRLLKNNDA